MQCKRFRGKINIQRPRAPHFERALFNAVTEPRYPKQSAVEICQMEQSIKRLQAQSELATQLHPYQLIQSKELFECFDQANMILLCQKNSMNEYDFFKFKVECHKLNVKCKVFSRKVIKQALNETRFAAMLPLLMQTNYNCMLFSDEWNVGPMLKVFKKTPKVLFLAGALNDRYMSRGELERFAALPDLTMVRAQFVATLNSVGGQLTNHLQSHQSNLCYMLDAHADILKTAVNSTKDSNQQSQDSTEK